MNNLLFLPIALILAASSQAATTVYDVSFIGTWTTLKNDSRPGSAHFSPVVGVTHNSSVAFWATGSLASSGIEDVAEIGSTSALLSEIAAARSAGTADKEFVSNTGPGPESTYNFQITVDSDFSLVTLVSMIAPSSDWFVGLRDYDLSDGSGGWKESATINLNSYDAGTESGNNFALGGPGHFTTSDPIELLSTAEPTGPLASSGSIASVTFNRVNLVPEPSSMTLLGLGGLAAIWRRKR